MLLKTPASGPLAKAYWDSKAASYPQPDSPTAAAHAEFIHKEVELLGVSFENRTILDVGAGSGLHTIPMAKHAREVVAVDISHAMMTKIADRLPNNVSLHVADFLEVDIGHLGWRGKFDLVWASMTPVSGEPRGLDKMDESSCHQVCCVTWGVKRDDPIVEEAFRLHGEVFTPPSWRDVIIDHNWNRMRKLRHKSFFREMKSRVTSASLLAELGAHLLWLGVQPDFSRLKSYCESMIVDGEITRIVKCDQEIWVWETQ